MAIARGDRGRTPESKRARHVKFFAVCDCVPLNTLAEAEEMFAGFEPLDE